MRVREDREQTNETPLARPNSSMLIKRVYSLFRMFQSCV